MKAANGFREDELVSRKQKLNGEWIETYFSRVGGRLRLAHESNGNLSIFTEVVRLEDDGMVVVKATASTEKGSFSGFGTASAQRDARLADSLLELAETRSIARALRFSGYGMEFTGAEEISRVIPDPVDSEQKGNGGSGTVFKEGNGNGKSETKSQKNGKATQAQCRALYALSRKAKMQDEDIHGMLSPLQVASFEDLNVSDASRLIQYLQTEVSAA